MFRPDIAPRRGLLPQPARRDFAATILVGMNPRSSTPAESFSPPQAPASGALRAVLLRLASPPRFVTIERSAHDSLVPVRDSRSVFFHSIRSKEVHR
jgi:hypothetical protein